MLSFATAGHAEVSYRLDLPAGRLSDAVMALGRQADVSVSVPDPNLWRQPVPAVKGNMSVQEALNRMLGGIDARPKAIGERSWRIERRKSSIARRTPAPRTTAAPPPSPPQTATESADVQPIIVTASKRDVRLSDYPGAVNLLDGAELAFGGERGTDSILSRLASVSSTHLGAGRNKLFIRGIADSSFTGPTQATVGQYLGDVRLTYNAPDPDLRLYDIASVEVLEGPQGTLYGAGSLGGIIRVIRNSPRIGVSEGAMSVGLSATQHGDPGADMGGVLNVPLSEATALRVVGYGVSEGGYIDDITSGRKDINRTRIAGGRATFRAETDDGWSVELGGTFQDTHGADSQYADRDGPPLTRASPIDQGFDAQYWLGDVVVGKSWGDIHFLSSTGVAGQEIGERYDASEQDGPLRLFRQHNDTSLFTTENRLWRPMRDGIGWVIGGSYTRNRTRLSRALGPIDAPVPVTGVTNKISEFTLYGEASIEVVRGLTATGGGRYTHARLSGSGEDVDREIALAGAQVAAKRDEESILPSIALSATVLPKLVVFTRFQEGFRPGGLAIVNDFVRQFRNDRVSTLETGIRFGDPGRGKFDISATFAHTRWKDIQADYIDGSGFPTTANIGDGRIYSIAATAGWRPLPGLAIDLAFAFNDGRITDPAADLIRTYGIGTVMPAVPGPITRLVEVEPVLGAMPGESFRVVGPTAEAATYADRMGEIPNVAKFAGRAGIDYQTPISDNLDLRVAASIRYIGRSRLGLGPVLGERQGDYLDTALTARVGRDGFGVTIGVTNLTDSIGNRFALGTPFDTTRQITPLRPRTIRIGLDASF